MTAPLERKSGGNLFLRRDTAVTMIFTRTNLSFSVSRLSSLKVEEQLVNKFEQCNPSFQNI